MKKLILLALTALMMVGCTERNSDGSVVLDSGLSNPRVNIIDSCEYISWGYGMTHKGNCRFCEQRKEKDWQRRKQELKELVEQLKDK